MLEDKNKNKVQSVQDQVGGKVNAGIMDAVAGICEDTSKSIDTWYRGFNSKFGNYGVPEGCGMWITEEPGYAKCYANEFGKYGKIAEVTIDWSKIAFLTDGEIYGYNMDPWQSVKLKNLSKLIDEGFNAWLCSYDNSCSGLYLFDNTPIVSIRVLSQKEYDSIETILDEAVSKTLGKSTITLYHGVNRKKLEYCLDYGAFKKRVCAEGGPEAIWLTDNPYNYEFTFEFKFPVSELNNKLFQQSNRDYTFDGDISFDEFDCKLFKTDIFVHYKDFAVQLNILDDELSARQLKMVPDLPNVLAKEFENYPMISEHILKTFLEKHNVEMPNAVEEGAEPESDTYGIGFEGDSNNEYAHVLQEEKSSDKDTDVYYEAMESIADFMEKEGLRVHPLPSVELNWDEQDGLFIKTGYYSPEEKKVVLFCDGRHIKDILRSYAHEMVHHAQNLEGKNLSFTSNDDVKDNKELEKLEAEAYLKGNIMFRKWTEYKNKKKETLQENTLREKKWNGDGDELTNLEPYTGPIPPVLYHTSEAKNTLSILSKGLIPSVGDEYSEWWDYAGPNDEAPDDEELPNVIFLSLKPNTWFDKLNFFYEYNFTVFEVDTTHLDKNKFFKDPTKSLYKEGCICYSDIIPASALKVYTKDGLNEETSPADIDLSSFNIKKELNPKFWKDERLDSRIRMKLLDLADDFIEFLGVTWVKPDDIIMTGSLANFNWHQKYSDIDLHIVMDYSKVDKRKDFVSNYFYSQKKLWNDEHKNLKIYGFPVEVYVQDTNEKSLSSGVYSLEKDKWLEEPDRKPLAKSKVNKSYIKEKVAEFANKIDKLNDLFVKAKGDKHKIENISDDAEALFKEIISLRRKSLETAETEISNGNIIFKCLRRLGLIEKLSKLKSKSYDKINSIT